MQNETLKVEPENINMCIRIFFKNVDFKFEHFFHPALLNYCIVFIKNYSVHNMKTIH
jgi:hypothetical protein